MHIKVHSRNLHCARTVATFAVFVRKAWLVIHVTSTTQYLNSVSSGTRCPAAWYQILCTRYRILGKSYKVYA